MVLTDWSFIVDGVDGLRRFARFVQWSRYRSEATGRPHVVTLRRSIATFARLACSLLWLARAAMAQDAQTPPSGPGAANIGAGHYRGSLRWYIADLKTSFPEHKSYSAQSALTAANYRTVLSGLKTNVGVNGIRLPIFPRESHAGGYAPLYREIVSYARSLGLVIYASPMSVGMRDFAGWSDDQYAAWLADYANQFRPEFLSPFNEAGISDEQMAEIVRRLRPMLTTQTLILGPDRQHVDKTVEDLSHNGSMAQMFDIVDSHNANRDGSATLSNWSELVQREGRPVWSSENPANWSVGADGSLPGADQAVNAGVQGLVIWAAKPSLVDDRGDATQKARGIVDHLAN